MAQESREEQDGEQPRLHVDEDWKKAVAEEKERLREQERAREEKTREQPAEERTLPKPDLQVFLAGLYRQALMALGTVPHPVTQKQERNPEEAEYLIDTIAMLQEKMKGNLSATEQAYVSNVLYDLRMRYVSPETATESASEAPTHENE